MLQSIGIVTPIALSNLDSEKNSFDCVTGDGKTLSLSLWYGSIDDFPTLVVNDGNLCSRYDYYDWGKNLHLELSSTVIKRNGSKLYNYYYDIFCSRYLTLPGDYYVTVKMYDPTPCNENSVRFFDFRQSIEDYLIGLRFPCTAQDIYKKVMKLCSFDSNIVSSIKCINISVYKILSRDEKGNIDKKHTMSEVAIEYGKVHKYVINENDVVYSISKNGDWVYSTPFVCYSFSANNNHIAVTIDADKDVVCTISNAEMIKTACEKVNSIRDKIN